MAKKGLNGTVQVMLSLDKVKVDHEKAGKARGNHCATLELSGSIHLEDVQKLLSDEHANNMLGFLYNGDSELATQAFAKLTVGTVIKDATVTVGEGKLQTELKDALVEDLIFIPQAGRQLEFSCRVHANPKPKQQNTIEYELLKEVIKVTFSGGKRVNESKDQQELPLEGKAGAGEAAEA